MTQQPLIFEPEPPRRTGFHVIKLSGSKKLQRLHAVLTEVKGRKLTSLELTIETKLVAISTWISHLRHNGIDVKNETIQLNGETVWRYWI
jgi:hypothetical protein